MFSNFNPLILKPPKQFKAPTIKATSKKCSYCYKHLGEWDKTKSYPLNLNTKKIIISYKGEDYINLKDNNVGKNPKKFTKFWFKI